MAVKLIGHVESPYVMRPRIAFNLKGVEYEFLEETHWSKSKSELLLNSNPVYKKIPVLLHNDKPISESPIIVQYIDDVWSPAGAAILPSDPYERAVARFWGHYIDDKWFASMKDLARAQTEEAQGEAIDQIFTGLSILEEAFEKSSQGKAFFGGDSIGYVDIALGSCLGWVRASEKLNGIKFLDEAKTPHLAAWAEQFSANEAVKGVMPSTDFIVEFAKKIFVRYAAPPSK